MPAAWRVSGRGGTDAWPQCQPGSPLDEGSVPRRWRAHRDAAGFVSVAMPTASLSSVAVTVEPIRLELRRCASSVILQWPASAAAECGAWLRDWLR